MSLILSDIEILIRDRLRGLECYARLRALRVTASRCLCGWDATVEGVFDVGEQARCDRIIGAIKRRYSLS